MAVPSRRARPVRAALAEVASWLDPDTAAPAPVEVSLVRAERRAMATRFEVALSPGPLAVAAASDALDVVDHWEGVLTVYRDDSDVSEVNRLAVDGPVVVDAALFGLFEQCARLTRDTGGAFDAAAGALSRAWGFRDRRGRVPSPEERRAAMQATGTRHVLLNATERSVRFLRPGVEWNFGAIGKGFALDRAAARLREAWGIRSALLHGGASSVLAVGSPPGLPGWRVAVRHPWVPGRLLGTLDLRGRALGTSAATYQYFDAGRKRYGHVLDPRRGRPAEGVAQACAVADTAAEADALSTALYVMGVEQSLTFLKSRPDVGALLLPDGDDAGVLAVNLGPEVFRPAE